MGVVHHTHYLTWFEVGRTEFMRERGYAYAELERDGIFMPVIEASCRYHAPARYDDEVEVTTSVTSATRVKVEFSYRVTRPSDGKLLATGRTVHAATDPSGAPRRMAAEVMDALGLNEPPAGDADESR
jgi:acyl-CoA thioester hydrolase